MGAAVLASCSSSTTPSSTSTSSNLTKSTLTIGVIASETATTGTQTGQDVPITATAWQNWTNSHGGVNGHPVKVVVRDDGGDPARSTSILAGFIANQSVLAVIDDTQMDTAWQSKPGPAGLPVICGNSTGNGFTCQANAAFFPTGNTVIAGVYGQTLISKLLNKPRFGLVYCSELAACAQAVPLNRQFSAQQGVQVVYAQAASESAPNYTAECLGLQNAKAQVVFGYAGSTKIAGDCARQNYNPTWVVAQGAISAVYRTSKYFDGAVGPLGTWLWSQDTTPAQHAFREALSKYWPNFDAFISPYNATSTWAALQLFATAGAKFGAHPTRQDLYTGLYGLPSGFTLGGLIPPETITKGKPTVNPCFFEVGIKNEKYIYPFGKKTFCQPSS